MEARNISYDGEAYKVDTITLPSGREIDVNAITYTSNTNMAKYKSILRNSEGELIREMEHDTRQGAEKCIRHWKWEYTAGGDTPQLPDGWTTEIKELDFDFEKPDGFDEYLGIVKAEVERIGKGYTCNFMYRGLNQHHINGANHFCFSIEGDRVHPLSVGGSRFCYPNDFTHDEFIEELENILLTEEEIAAIHSRIWKEIRK